MTWFSNFNFEVILFGQLFKFCYWDIFVCRDFQIEKFTSFSLLSLTVTSGLFDLIFLFVCMLQSHKMVTLTFLWQLLADVHTSFQHVGLHNVYRFSSEGIGLLHCVYSDIYFGLVLVTLILDGQWFPRIECIYCTWICSILHHFGLIISRL